MPTGAPDLVLGQQSSFSFLPTRMPTYRSQERALNCCKIFRLRTIFRASDLLHFIAHRSRKNKEAKGRSCNHTFSETDSAAQTRAESQHGLQLLVTNQDIFASRMNFVFGLANSELGVAVMSTFRLTRWDEDLTPSHIQERILKEAAHEIGHLVGLAHCENHRCLMSFSEILSR